MNALGIYNGEYMPTVEQDVLFSENQVSNNVELFDFEYNKDRSTFVLTFKSNLFKDNNYRISVESNVLSIQVREQNMVKKPNYFDSYDMLVYNNYTYERIKTVDFVLPGDNFFVVNHYALPDSNTLKVYLNIKRE